MIYSACNCSTRPSVRYLIRVEKRMIWKEFVGLYSLGSKVKPLLSKQSVKFNVIRCGLKLLRDLLKSSQMRLAAPSLHYITGSSCGLYSPILTRQQLRSRNHKQICVGYDCENDSICVLHIILSCGV